jgi:hypothetical protein
LKSVEGRVELGLKTATDLANTEISMNERHIGIERWKGVFDPLKLTSGQGRAELTAVASSSLAAGAASGPRGEMKIAALEADVGQFDVRVQAGAAALECTAVGRGEGFSGLAYEKESLPEVRINVGAARARLARASIFDEFQLRNLDTGNVDQRTHLNVAAALDGRTNVRLSGWASGPMENEDLDVTARVENLHLPTYSPYFEKSAGVRLESGRLDGTAIIKATKGNLRGEIQVALADTSVRPLTEAHGERISESLGVPLEMAVDLLKDFDGRIALTLPITGRLSRPHLDFGPTVDKAERTRAVRRYLTEEKGVDAARVSECRSTFEAADQGSPRVDVSF